MGLIKERGKQRSDSIAMLVKVRRLSRTEMVVETLRPGVVALVEANREWCEEIPKACCTLVGWGATATPLRERLVVDPKVVLCFGFPQVCQP